jgi:hypothetical protein
LRVGEEDVGLFIGSHHRLGNEVNNSKHATLECQTCHNAHASTHYDEDAAGDGIIQTCEDCHFEQVNTYAEGSPLMNAAGVKCVDCHMPKASVNGDPVNEYVGNRATHLFKINPDGSAPQFEADSSATMPYIGVGFACLSCHGDSNVTDMEISEDKTGWDVAMAGKYARSVHRSDNDIPNYYAGVATCATCHETLYKEWNATDHGHDMRSDTTNENTNESGRDFITAYGGGCQACHVVGYNDPTGYNDIALRADATTEDSLRLEGIQCESCHGPSGQHAEDGAVKYSLTDVDYNSSCIRCHVASYDQLTGIGSHVGPADSAGVEGHSSGLHHPQSLLFYGLDLYEYPGESYSHSAHATQVVDGCRTCHMYPGTGHDLMTDEEACMDCHADFTKTSDTTVSALVSGHTLEFNYQSKQATIDTLYFTLDSLLQAAVDTSKYDSATIVSIKAYFPYKAAYYNMRSIRADKSYGVHDYEYISKILKDGIADTARYLDLPQKLIDQAVADSIAQFIADSLEYERIKDLVDTVLADTLP